MEQRWSKGEVKVEQRWNKGGAKVEQRWSKGEVKVEQYGMLQGASAQLQLQHKRPRNNKNLQENIKHLL